MCWTWACRLSIFHTVHHPQCHLPVSGSLGPFTIPDSVQVAPSWRQWLHSAFGRYWMKRKTQSQMESFVRTHHIEIKTNKQKKTRVLIFFLTTFFHRSHLSRLLNLINSYNASYPGKIQTGQVDDWWISFFQTLAEIEGECLCLLLEPSPVLPQLAFYLLTSLTTGMLYS